MSDTVRGTRALQDFFDRQGDALSAGDLAGVATGFAMPGMVVSDDCTFSLNSPTAVESAFTGAIETYHDKGLVETRAKLTKVEWLTDRLVLAAVCWEYRDSEGGVVPGESYRYLLRLVDGDQPLICVAIPTG